MDENQSQAVPIINFTLQNGILSSAQCEKYKLLGKAIGPVDIIVAHSWPEMGIGANGQLPWSIKADLQHFRKITSNAPVNKINIRILKN